MADEFTTAELAAWMRSGDNTWISDPRVEVIASRLEAFARAEGDAPSSAKDLAERILGSTCACYAEAFPATTCDKQRDEVALMIEGSLPAEGWKPSGLAEELEKARELIEKYKWQVRDACRRAEKAEATLDEVRNERDAWKQELEITGRCMSCAVNAVEPCTDCLGTEWDQGENPWSLLTSAEAEIARLTAECLDADRRVEKMRERCARLIERGSFLHDQSPPALFAREVVPLIRALPLPEAERSGSS